ncbi:enoyl-CoA hydratase [Rhizocola hellebori]|uniref:Enoyl-CoA hydratase n=1 Tax=Rhizocola hellebori TaxID=1392758 RepID=A0A8J3VFD0_9ACTN|nr:enoyl-CoA hydratase-related protein [Rhizocola hellebori]GIH04106.1 enoyl-CoA hydratase [Rhizocola hellebori]
MTGTLTVQTAGPVATIRIDHHAKRNAMTAAMWRSLPVLLAQLQDDPQVRAVVLTGAGDTFCAGADIADLATIGTETAGDNLAVAAEEALAGFAKPTIAQIRGDCVGGGCQLALACDIRLAAHDARFGITPAKLGVVYPATSIRRLVNVAGLSTAQWLLLTAELLDATQAQQLRLVHELCPADTLQQRTADVAATLASRSLLSQVAMKQMMADPQLPAAQVQAWMDQVRDSGEAAEGAAAFLQRRAPRFPWTPHR